MCLAFVAILLGLSAWSKETGTPSLELLSIDYAFDPTVSVTSGISSPSVFRRYLR
jgi:hypothetical protein